MRKAEYNKRLQEIKDKKLGFFNERKELNVLKQEAGEKRKAFFQELREQKKVVEQRVKDIDLLELPKEDKKFLQNTILGLRGAVAGLAIMDVAERNFFDKAGNFFRSSTALIYGGMKLLGLGLSVKKGIKGRSSEIKQTAKEKERSEEWEKILNIKDKEERNAKMNEFVTLEFVNKLIEKDLLTHPMIIDTVVDLLPSINRAQTGAIDLVNKIFSRYLTSFIDLKPEVVKRLTGEVQQILDKLLTAEVEVDGKTMLAMEALLRSGELKELMTAIGKNLTEQAEQIKSGKEENIDLDIRPILGLVAKALPTVEGLGLDELLGKEQLVSDIVTVAKSVDKIVKKSEENKQKKEEEKQKNEERIKAIKKGLGFKVKEEPKKEEPKKEEPKKEEKKELSIKDLEKNVRVFMDFGKEVLNNIKSISPLLKDNEVKEFINEAAAGDDAMGKMMAEVLPIIVKDYPTIFKLLASNVSKLKEKENVKLLTGILSNPELKKIMEMDNKGVAYDGEAIEFKNMIPMIGQVGLLVASLDVGKTINDPKTKEMLNTAVGQFIKVEGEEFEKLNDNQKEEAKALNQLLNKVIEENNALNLVSGVLQPDFVIKISQAVQNFGIKAVNKESVDPLALVQTILKEIKNNKDLKLDDLQGLHKVLLENPTNRKILVNNMQRMLDGNIALRRLDIDLEKTIGCFKDWKDIQTLVNVCDMVAEGNTIKGTFEALKISGAVGVAILSLTSLVMAMAYDFIASVGYRKDEIEEHMDKVWELEELEELKQKDKLDLGAMFDSVAKDISSGHFDHYILHTRNPIGIDLTKKSFNGAIIDQFTFNGTMLPSNFSQSVITACDFSKSEFQDGRVNLKGSKIDLESLHKLLANDKVIEIQDLDIANIVGFNALSKIEKENLKAEIKDMSKDVGVGK